MPVEIAGALARRLKLKPERIAPLCQLLDAGLSPVFIAHYRKTETGGMDEPTIRRVHELRRELETIEALRQRARHGAEQAGALTDALAKAFAEADRPETLDDLALPFRPKRRTAGAVALERGLGPLADYAWAGADDGPDLEAKAAEFVDPGREVRSPDEAVTGTAHMLAERIAEDVHVRQAVRGLVWEKAKLRSQQAKLRGKGGAEFRGYFNFTEPLSHIPPHRILAINRGERSKALKVSIVVPPEAVDEHIVPLIVPATHRFAAYLKRVAVDALARLVLPHVERQVRRQLTDRAEDHAIDVFASNLRSLLMTRPLRNRRVLVIQPGYRTGCKVATLDEGGALLGETIIYPLEPQKKWTDAKVALAAEIRRHAPHVVAIGNGTGCREVEALVSDLIEELALDLKYAIISEAGASVYADSAAAKREFPNLDAAIRAAVSIGRRLQDPIAELVKIDPRAIGVGLYQHDVNQQRLQRSLDETMESCAAAVGADANTASAPMLRRLPGLTDAHVAALVDRRAQAPIAGREQLKTLPGWDETAFLMAAGFLTVHGDNPLDATRIHPESYPAAQRLLAHIGGSPDDLKAAETARELRERLTGLALEPLVDELDIPLVLLLDLVGALQRPDYDPRQQHHGPILRQKMRRLEDLKPGMWVKGTVRNVVDFGAFVDIGLKEEGLIHISQFSNRYVRNPLKFLHVGDVLDVRIVSIDGQKHRIALTLIPDKPPAKREPRGKGKPPEAGAAPPRRGPPRPAAEKAPARPAAGPTEHRAPARTGGSDRRTDRQGAPAGRPDRGPRPRSDGPARGPRDRRPRTGPPRVIVSKPKNRPEDRPPDEKGRPKIRWAHYDSDPNQDLFDEDEDETLEPQGQPPEDVQKETPANETPPEPPADDTPS